MARTTVIAGNWKLWGTLAEAKALVTALNPIAQSSKHQVLVAPPFTAIAAVRAAAHARVWVAGQDCSVRDGGSFTGEVSARMLADVGANAVILGHSERRQYHGETDAAVNKKIQLALAAGLKVIYCNGESLAERDAGQAFAVVERQTREALAGLTTAQLANIMVAYEPVWAIGTGKTASAADAQAVHVHLRGVLKQMFGAEAAGQTSILYGGSVKPDNAQSLLTQPDIDGALVGGASLKAETFIPIIEFDKKE